MNLSFRSSGQKIGIAQSRLLAADGLGEALSALAELAFELAEIGETGDRNVDLHPADGGADARCGLRAADRKIQFTEIRAVDDEIAIGIQQHEIRRGRGVDGQGQLHAVGQLQQIAGIAHRDYSGLQGRHVATDVAADVSSSMGGNRFRPRRGHEIGPAPGRAAHRLLLQLPQVFGDEGHTRVQQAQNLIEAE